MAAMVRLKIKSHRSWKASDHDSQSAKLQSYCSQGTFPKPGEKNSKYLLFCLLGQLALELLKLVCWTFTKIMVSLTEGIQLLRYLFFLFFWQPRRWSIKALLEKDLSPNSPLLFQNDISTLESILLCHCLWWAIWSVSHTHRTLWHLAHSFSVFSDDSCWC